MNHMIDILRSRRSIRFYQDKPIANEYIESLKESLLRSPTSRGRNPWQFIVVDERQLLTKVSQAKAHGSTFISGAALAFIICADTTVSDVWIEDCAIAAITLQYTAHSLGLGSCWAQIRQREHDERESAETYLRKLLDIPQQVAVASVIGIGHPAEVKEGHLAEQLPENRFHQNSY